MATEQCASKKVYVKSGDLEWVGVATGPLDAIQRALKGGNKKLDGYFFFVDERGFRESNALWKVPIADGLSYAGYEFDDVPNEEDY